MHLNRELLGLACLLMLIVVSGVNAQEKRISKSDLPAAVQKSADEQSRGAIVRGYSREVEDGKTYYELKMNLAGHSKDVLFDPSGAVVEVEEEVTMESLSPTVQKGLLKAAGSGKIVKVESITKHDKLVAYEAKVQTGGKRSEVQVGPQGETLAHPE